MTLQELLQALTGRPSAQKLGPDGQYIAPESDDRARRQEYMTTIEAPPAPPPANDLMEALRRVQSGQQSPVRPDLQRFETDMQAVEQARGQVSAELLQQQEALRRNLADIAAQQSQEAERQQRIAATSGRDLASIQQPIPQTPALPAPRPAAVRPAPTERDLIGAAFANRANTDGDRLLSYLDRGPQSPQPTTQPQIPTANPRADTAPQSRFPLVNANLNVNPPPTGGRMTPAPLNPGQNIYTDRFQAPRPEFPFGPGGMPALSSVPPPELIGNDFRPPAPAAPPVNPIPAPSGPSGGPLVPANMFPASNEGRPGFSADELNRAERDRIIGLPSNLQIGPAAPPTPTPMRVAPEPAPIPPAVPQSAIQPQTIQPKMGDALPQHLKDQLLAEAARLTRERKAKPIAGGL